MENLNGRSPPTALGPRMAQDAPRLKAKYETAGCLGKGERTFITAKLPDYIRVGRNDCIEKYLFLSTTMMGVEV